MQQKNKGEYHTQEYHQVIHPEFTSVVENVGEEAVLARDEESGHRVLIPLLAVESGPVVLH